MDFQVIIATLASIVSIVGGVLGIISAVSKEPVFTHFWQHQSKTKFQPALQPSPSPEAPVERVALSPGAKEPSRQMVPPTWWKPGFFYGTISSILAVFIYIPDYALAHQTSSIAFVLLTVSAWIILSIADGLLPARVSGSVLSSCIAGGMLGLSLFLIIVIYEVITQQTLTGNLLTFYFVILCLLPFMISILFGLLGSYLHKKRQVPILNENTSTNIKQPSGNDAQQLQQTLHYEQRAPVQGKCPNCGVANQSGAKFCNQCGTKL